MRIHIGNTLRTVPRVKMAQKMNRKEGFSGEGWVEVRPFDLVNGEKVYRVDEFSRHNLIVSKGREGLIDLLQGVKPKTLKYIRWGKGGALAFPDGDPLVPLTVNDSDLDVASFLLDKQLSTPTRPSPTQLVYSETLISDEVNSDVNEAAVMFEDNTTFDRTIFARITFPTLRLTNDRGTGIDLTWTFNFTRSAEA